MIVRVLTARLPVERAAGLHDLMREQLPLLRAHDGLVYVKLARRLVGQSEELVLFEEWRDVDAMLVWTGTDIARPRLLPGAEDLIDDLRITHFEALDIDAPSVPSVWSRPDHAEGRAERLSADLAPAGSAGDLLPSD